MHALKSSVLVRGKCGGVWVVVCVLWLSVNRHNINKLICVALIGVQSLEDLDLLHVGYAKCVVSSPGPSQLCLQRPSITLLNCNYNFTLTGLLEVRIMPIRDIICSLWECEMYMNCQVPLAPVDCLL